MSDDDPFDEEVKKMLQHLMDHPEDRTPEFDRFVNTMLMSPAYEEALIERIRTDALAPQMMDTLISYAAAPQPSERRTQARRILSAGWRVDDSIN